MTQRSSSAWRVPILALVVIGSIALVPRLVHLDHAAHFDEMFHLLAGGSVTAGDGLRIPGGEVYDRAAGWTYLVSGGLAVFGNIPTVARIPSVIAGVLLVMLVFVWVSRIAGRAAGWTAALLLALSPGPVYYSQLARFYMMHTLLVVGGCILVYELTSGAALRRRNALLRWGVVVVILAGAHHLQILTRVPIALLAVWIAFSQLPALFRQPPRRRVWISASILFGAATVGLALYATGAIQHAWMMTHYADMWAESGRDNLPYYHWLLLNQHGVIWPLFPLALVLAATRYFRATLFCGWIFAASFTYQSLAVWKSERYLLYAMPMFFIVVGLAVGVALPWMYAQVTAGIRTTSRSRIPLRWAKMVAAGLLAVAACFVAYGSRAFHYTYDMMTLSDAEWPHDKLYRGESDWAGAVDRLTPFVADVNVLVASACPKALYHLGRCDVGLMATELVRPEGRADEFATHTTPLARPMIYSATAVDRLQHCFSSGLIVIETKHWNKGWAVPPATADFIEAHTERIRLPDGLRLMAFRWQGSGQTEVECDLPARMRP